MFESPLTPEKLAEILSTLRTGLEDLLGDQLEAVYLYGSHARGDAQPDSDIDVLVVLNGEFDYFNMIERTSKLTVDLSLENDTLVSLAFTSKKNYAHKMSPFLMNVREEGIAV
jgi:predicted nucleotidyltransferase